MKKHGGHHGALGMISHLGQVAQLEAAPGMEAHGHPEEIGRPIILCGSNEATSIRQTILPWLSLQIMWYVSLSHLGLTSSD